MKIIILSGGIIDIVQLRPHAIIEENDKCLSTLTSNTWINLLSVDFGKLVKDFSPMVKFSDAPGYQVRRMIYNGSFNPRNYNKKSYYAPL